MHVAAETARQLGQEAEALVEEVVLVRAEDADKVALQTAGSSREPPLFVQQRDLTAAVHGVNGYALSGWTEANHDPYLPWQREHLLRMPGTWQACLTAIQATARSGRSGDTALGRRALVKCNLQALGKSDVAADVNSMVPVHRDVTRFSHAAGVRSAGQAGLAAGRHRIKELQS